MSINPTERAPEFEELLSYLVATYGKEAGTAWYYSWLEGLGLNESMPMMIQMRMGKKFKGCNTPLELYQRQRKTKSTDKEKLQHLKGKLRQKIHLDAMSKDMKSGEFYAFAKRVRDADPIYQKTQKLLADKELIQIAQTHLESVAKANNDFVRARAIKDMSDFMTRTKNQRKKLDPSLLDEKWKLKLRHQK